MSRTLEERLNHGSSSMTQDIPSISVSNTSDPLTPSTDRPPLPEHLQRLVDTLKPALEELQKPTRLKASLADAAVLWE
jgi:hypothetical protein